jgi:hypothetical protein
MLTLASFVVQVLTLLIPLLLLPMLHWQAGSTTYIDRLKLHYAPSSKQFFMADRFFYSPIPVDSIRLITLQRQTEFGRISYAHGLLRPACTMSVVRLEDSPKFVAVSYAWGASTKVNWIRCNRSCLPVTKSVFDLLTDLGNPKLGTELPLWIDAICINQDDDAELAVQIRKMNWVYSQADEVIVWLGSTTRQGNEAMEIIPKLTETLSRAPEFLTHGDLGKMAYL